jgi:CheY-like chemotaxis protein
LQGVRILLVDDEPDGLDVVRQMLERAGAKVTPASSSAEAMELLAQHRPDLIISDIAMPGEDGYALVRRVRSLSAEAGGSTPAVALSAYSRDEDRQQALTAGFQAHVAKPVEPAGLLEALLPWVPQTRPEESRIAADATVG